MPEYAPFTSVYTPADPAAVKAATLLSHEAAMLATVAKYNLDRDDHRRASSDALRRLFFDLVRAVEIDLFVEAGANEATASRRVAARLEQARVVAFEANPFIYKKYCGTWEGTRVEYRHNALTDQPGPVTFNILKNDEGVPIVNGRSSLLKRSKVGDAERGFEEVTVEGVSLDGYFADASFERAALWVDVEGGCRLVLGGAGDVLRRTALVMVEVEELEWWGGDHWMREQVVSYLYDHGLVPVARDYEYRHQYNIVFVRAALLANPSRIRWTLTRFMSAANSAPRKKNADRPTAKAAKQASVAQPVSMTRKFRRRLGRSPALRRALDKAAGR